MGDFELAHFQNAEDLARSAAGDWLKALPDSGARGRPYLVALSGGRIAARFFETLAVLARPHASVLRTVHFFWGDERCVPPQDPESNFGLARDRLFAPLGVPDSQVHRIRGEDPPELAAASAEMELRTRAACLPDDQPVLDLAFLGVGEDGHIASLFPGESPAMAQCRAVFRVVTATKPPPRRITLGYPALAAAREVWVMASGPGKEEAFKLSLTPQGATPLARLLKLRAHTRLLTDIALDGVFSP